MAFKDQFVSRYIAEHANVAGPKVTTSLEFRDNTVLLKIETLGDDATATWTVDADRKSLTFNMAAQKGEYATCIITCLGGSVGKALLECLSNSATMQEIENCLRDKAVLADAATCIAHCFRRRR